MCTRCHISYSCSSVSRELEFEVCRIELDSMGMTVLFTSHYDGIAVGPNCAAARGCSGRGLRTPRALSTPACGSGWLPPAPALLRAGSWAEGEAPPPAPVPWGRSPGSQGVCVHMYSRITVVSLSLTETHASHELLQLPELPVIVRSHQIHDPARPTRTPGPHRHTTHKSRYNLTAPSAERG